MSIHLNWVNQTDQSEKCIMVTSSVATLKVYQCNGVILKTEWSLDKGMEGLLDSTIFAYIQNYLNNPKETLIIKLRIQGSEFRRKVWSEIANIPVGQVLSYSELSDKVDSGARAVANACRDNPFPGLIPCHRVVAKNGLGGFMGERAGQYLDLKRRLLEMEKVLVSQ